MMPWSSLVRDDLRRCYKLSCVAQAVLPNPCDDSCVWYDLMRVDADTWTEVVQSICFYESVCDKSRSKAYPEVVASFVCSKCNQSFAHSKALQSHVRAKHGIRTDRRLYAAADGVCRACNKKFSTRLRLIAHWSDKRRPKCWSWVLTNATPLPTSVVAELDELDKVQCRQARQIGHTVPLSSGPVVQAHSA